MKMIPRQTTLSFALVLIAGAGPSCATGVPLSAELRPLELATFPRKAALLKDNHFKRDAAGSISEDDLKRVLDSLVFLADGARIGVVPVSNGYEPDSHTPVVAVPGELQRALEDAGLFKGTTEISTDWPSDRGVSGLRELSARYRAEYLLLYRQRFVDRSHTNAWGWLYPTVVGALFAPARTIETAGVLEATLFEARTGTLLFTVFERVYATAEINHWNNDKKLRDIQGDLLKGAAKRLGDQVVSKSRRLAALRPGTTTGRASAERLP